MVTWFKPCYVKTVFTQIDLVMGLFATHNLRNLMAFVLPT